MSFTEFAKGFFTLGKNMRYVNGVIKIAGMAPIDEVHRYGFMFFHNYFTNPQPEWVNQLRANEKSNKWYARLADGIFHNTQGARRAAQYHLDRIYEIENQVQNYLNQFDSSNIPQGSCIAIGNTQKLDFEYHAFVFAYRRTLEYFAAAIAAYSKDECGSFKDLSNILKKPKFPASIASPILKLIDEYSPKFNFVLTTGSSRSVRDKIAHFEFVSAGTFNLTSDGFRLLGGGEQLDFVGPPQRLCDVLSERINILDDFLNKTLVEFAEALKSLHK